MMTVKTWLSQVWSASDILASFQPSSEPGLRGELPATGAEGVLLRRNCQAVWSEAT